MLKRKHIAVLLVISLGLMILATGCGGQQKEAETTTEVATIKIGSLHPLTGGSAYEGCQINNALHIAIDEINAAGGIKSMGGAKIEIVEGDTTGDPAKAVTEFQKLLREKVVIVAGCYNSAVTYPITQEAEKAKMPFVVSIASAKDIMERGFKYIFRLQPTGETFARDALEYTAKIKTPEMKTAAIVGEDSINGTLVTDYLHENIAKSGLQEVIRVAYSAKTASLDSEVNKIKAANPDIIFAVGNNQDQTLFIKTVQRFNVTANIVGVANGAIGGPNFVKDMGENAELLMDINYAPNYTNPKTQAFMKTFKEKYGMDMATVAAYGYTTGLVIADALERAGSTDPEKLREALAQTSFKDHILPQAEIKFSSNGENANAKSAIMQIQNGKQLIVYPEEYAQADIIFPNSKYWK